MEIDTNLYGVALAEKMKMELPYDHVKCKGIVTYGAIADIVARCGDSNYLEIGTWRGASAIVAASTKKEFMLGGLVYCVDHFRGYNDQFIGTDNAQENFRRYGVSDIIKIIVSPSRPFPLDHSMKFGSAFIDGNHWGDNPYLDFIEIEPMVERFILMDDYNTDFEHTVIECVDKILREFPMWKIAWIEDGHHALLERIGHD